MSWISNYLFGEHSDASYVPDSYETAVADSYEKPTNSYDKPTDYTVDSYQQPGYSGYGYGGEQPGYSSYGYGGEQPDYGYGCEHPFVQRDYPEAGHGGEEERPLDDDGEPYPIVVSFETDRTFSSRNEIVDWVQKRGIDNGYVIVIKRSKKRGEEFVKVFFQCSLGGDHKSVATVRKTGSKKIGCPFELIGVFESKRGVWRLNVRNPWHNHTPIENLEGHAYARRLSSENKRLVKEMADQEIPNRTIWRTLMKNNPDKKVITKDIHNAVQKINAEKRFGESPMQQLENVLMEKDYTYYTRENKNINAVEDVFFVHPHSFTMWCAFPHVLLIDATYSTNMYNLPFVQVVGMTSTNQSFAVAHAVISSEKVENYLWVLGKIRSMLDGCMEPRVIITDRELALISACEQTFPKAHLYLCRFHIQQNVAKNSKKKFTDKEWKQFLRSFAILCESPTEKLYEYNLTNFEGHLRETGHGQAFEYLKENWLDTYRHKFVSAWTNETINFHQTTTNRVEGMHSLLKSHLPSHHNTLVKLVGFVDHMVEKQYTEIKRGFETSLRKMMNHHKKEPMLSNLLRKISIYAIELLYFELRRMEDGLRVYGSTCGCQLFTSCGLPCACRLEQLQQKGN